MSEPTANKLQSSIQGFSPVTRKILAIGILFLTTFAFWTLILSPTIFQMDAGLTELNDTRFQRMRLEQIQNRPAPEPVVALPANFVLQAASAEEAQAAFGAQINALAAQNGLAPIITPKTPTKGSKLLAFDISISAPEVSIVSFINSLEHGSPMMRFRTWQADSAVLSGNADPNIPQPEEGLDPALAGGDGTYMNGNVQFSGQIVGAWIKS